MVYVKDLTVTSDIQNKTAKNRKVDTRCKCNDSEFLLYFFSREEVFVGSDIKRT